MIVDGNGAVIEKNDYYPFGARHKRNDYLMSDNRYKFNGKEEQVVGDVGFLDYGARMYDAAIGKWMVMDPMGEKYYGITSYAFSLNNPSSIIDPDGRDVDISNLTDEEQRKALVEFLKTKKVRCLSPVF